MVLRMVGLLIGYLLGCFQTAYIVGKFVNKIDIRQHGSGNSGTTNAIRVLGWKLGAVTFFSDILKAVFAVILVRLLFDEAGEFPIHGAYAGLGVILGHVWPVFLKFKGGKGIASSIGAMLALLPILGVIMMLIMTVAVLTSKYVSLGSIAMVIAIPVYLLIFHINSPEGIIVASLITVITLFKHSANIKRLIAGTESKIGHKKDATKEETATS